MVPSIIETGPVLTGALKSTATLATTLHSSTRFKDQFELVFGDAAIPSSVVTRWNSLHKQVKAVVKLDSQNLTRVLEKSEKLDLDITGRERDHLRHLAKVLVPFSKATDITQGDKVRSQTLHISVCTTLTRLDPTQYDWML